MKAEELKIKKQMENGHYGYGVQFVYDYSVELTKLNELIVNGYDELFGKFKNMYKEYAGTDWKEAVILQPPAQTQVENKKKRKTADETLIKETKKKTKKKQGKKESELDMKADELLDLKNVVSNATELFSDNLSKVTISNKTEYVSTTTSNSGTTRKKSTSKKSKASLNKNESIIKKTVIQTQVILEKDDDDGDDGDDIDEKDEKEPSEPVNNPSKKLRLTIKQENNHSETIVKPQEHDASADGSSEALSVSKANKKPKRTKSKKKLSKIKHSKGGNDDMFRMPVPLAQSSLSSSKMNDTTIISSNVLDLKTPSKAQTNEKRLEKIMESNSKTIKANVQVEKTNQSNQQQQQVKPMTRRAAAAAAAAAANSTASTIAASASKVKQVEAPSVGGKVKQMIEAVEARMKTVQNTPGSALKQNAASSSSLMRSTVKPVQSVSTMSKTQSTTNTNANKDGKLRSSIDKRKERISLSKAEQKRQSIKRVNAFLKDITEQTPSNQHDKNANSTQTNTVINTQAKLASAVKPSSVRVKLFPTESATQNATNINNTTSMSNDTSIMSVKTLIVNSSTVQQNYRVAPQTVKNTPSVRKQSFVKFLERNTPSKMTKTELEEKRKIELMFKEKKEQERLHEREKLLQEKIEISKKKREEKMRKIEELKVKKQEEDQKKKEEIEAKLREAEENKKRILEEKKREELEKQKAKEQRLAQEKQHQEKQIASATTQSTTTTTMPAISNSNSITSSSSIVAQNYQQQSAHKPLVHKVQLISSNHGNLKSNNENQVPLSSNSSSSSNHENLSTFKPVKPMSNNPLQTLHMNKPTASGSNNSALETTYLLKATSHQMNSHHMENYVKSKLDNYDISDLNSEDETDDEEEPSKPIPAWAKDPILVNSAILQNHRMINFTKLFKASSQNEIDLHAIFKIKRKKFDERSSSANWNTPPIWLTNGINGNESFRQLHK